jgi:hypothetical protein
MVHSLHWQVQEILLQSIVGIDFESKKKGVTPTKPKP